MTTDRHVRALNNLLRTELGENPVHGWVFGSQLLYPLPKYYDDGITQQYGHRCTCGLDVRVHRPCCSGMVLAEALYELRNPFPELSDRWILCSRQLANGDGRLLNRWYWMPLGFRNVRGLADTVCLQRGEIPALETTWEFIRMCREHRSRTLKESAVMEMAEAESKRREQSARMVDDIRDTMSLSINPGAKGEMSFPSVDPKSKDQTQTEVTL